MSDYDDYDENDNNSPGDIRKALEKALKRAKEAEAKATAAEERAAKAEKSVKSQSLASLLSERKVPSGLAKFLEKDDVEATAEAVDSWLKENGELFNLKPAEEKEPEAEKEAESEIDPELAAALDLSGQLDSQGANAPLREINKAINDLSDELSYEEGLAQMRQLGIVN